ncbi:hypothetical protein lbkm_1533 [Lachnospiraceae bacterium KM106-2]|nr:hypothetical protein lbkm_1533 [Lachnospiraceae bacterium KM106-2]
MLEKIDLEKKLGKDEFHKKYESLSEELGHLQRDCRANNIPIIILFEGLGASGKGTIMNYLIHPLDPRGFKVFTLNQPTEDEILRPYLWRYWIKTPAKGRIHIFDHSWYHRVLGDRLEGITDEKELEFAYDEIVDFEEQLSVDGTVIMKFFLHISKKEQAKRLKEMEESKSTAWRVTKKDWHYNEKYKELLVMNDEMLAKTDTSFAPWDIVESNDLEYAAVKILSLVVNRLKRALEERKNENSKEEPKIDIPFDERLVTHVLQGVDLSVSLTKKEYKDKLKVLQRKLACLQNLMVMNRIPVILAFEGWDAAGKGGNIKRLTEKLDPRNYEVIPISAPNDIEKAHHYLWRFWRTIPKAGNLAIYDRTWYGRVLVERIEGFCTKQEYERAYSEINRMERQFTNAGYIVLKFWLHIDKNEQEARFKDRQENPEKQWKITDEDWRNREKWDEYEKAVDEMIIRTSTVNAPWIVVEANSKYYARIKVLETVVDALTKYMQEIGILGEK